MALDPVGGRRGGDADSDAELIGLGEPREDAGARPVNRLELSPPLLVAGPEPRIERRSQSELELVPRIEATVGADHLLPRLDRELVAMIVPDLRPGAVRGLFGIEDGPVEIKDQACVGHGESMSALSSAGRRAGLVPGDPATAFLLHDVGVIEPRAEEESASRRVYSWTRSQILDGSLAGGTLVSEGEVADAIGVSRTPVREAFLQLAAEGMLKLYPKRGALVVPVSATELAEVVEARGVVEPWAATIVASRTNRAAAVVRLRELLAAAAEARALGDERAFQEADREFHLSLLSAAGNSLLATFHSSLRDRQLRGGALALRADPLRSPKILDEHAAIADAIEAGDPVAAGAAVRTHLAGTLQALGLAARG